MAVGGQELIANVLADAGLGHQLLHPPTQLGEPGTAVDLGQGLAVQRGQLGVDPAARIEAR